MAHHWQFARPAFSSLALVIGLFAATAQAADPTVLQVNAFPNAKALPLHAGIAKGIFERRGLKLELDRYRKDAEEFIRELKKDADQIVAQAKLRIATAALEEDET